MGTRDLERVRAIVLGLPEVTERLSHGAPSFFLRDKRSICYFHDGDFSADGRVSLWCRAPVGAQDALIAGDPDRYFAPTPSATGVFRDWIGVFLDQRDVTDEEWDEIAAIIEDGYRLVAPKKLIAELDTR